MRHGMMREDLFVTVHDTVWTDSCNYADIVLPADTQLERTDFHGAYGYYHYAMNLPVIEPLGESRSTQHLPALPGHLLLKSPARAEHWRTMPRARRMTFSSGSIRSRVRKGLLETADRLLG